jgi:hypothetical protein
VAARSRYLSLCWLAVWPAVLTAQPAAPPGSAPPASAPASEEGKCGLLVDTPDGKGALDSKPDLHPLIQTGPDKQFTLDAPADAAVMCGRTSILPKPYDIQVVLTGHAFYIINKGTDRIGVLEISEGLCEFRMVKGELTQDEEKALQPILDEMQKIANAGTS